MTAALTWTAQQIARAVVAAATERAASTWRPPASALDRLVAAMGAPWRSGPETARLLGVHPSHALLLLREAIRVGVVEKREYGRRRAPQYRAMGLR